MNSYRYKISLRVRHPSMDPAEITSVLRFAPSRSWRAHERRSTPSGESLEGVSSETYWTARVMAAEWPGKDLAVAIAEVLDQLESSRGFLAKIRSERGTVELFVGWFLNGQTGEAFDYELLARLADFKISLSLDVYPPDAISVP
jgi:hypothetical protein